jgi:hypothetical protein
VSDCENENTFVIASEWDSRPFLDRYRPLLEIEREHIECVLQAVSWRIEGRGGAAQILGLRASTLRTRMQKLAIARPKTPRRGNESGVPSSRSCRRPVCGWCSRRSYFWPLDIY